MAIASVVFVCAYRVHGQSADLLPFLFAGFVMCGVAISALLAWQTDRVRRFLAIGFLTVMCVVTVGDAPHRRHTGAKADATSFVAELDIQTLPKDAVICTGWRVWPPLRYAQCVLTKRSDIDIINADPKHWLWMIEGTEDRPVFFTRNFQEVRDLPLTRYRNLWRLERRRSPDQPTSADKPTP